MRGHMAYPRRAAPAMVRVTQHLPGDHILDVRKHLRGKLEASGLLADLQPGARVAITAGSRGIGAFVELLAGAADAVKAAGGEPFLIPAMGSHGGSTPEGQTEILRLLGVTEGSMGAAIRATMDTIPLGPAHNGAVAHLDRIAAEADGIIVLGRTKTHPESAEGVASGLLKMTTVGLGKQKGAQEAHSHGLWASVKAVPGVTLERANVLCGIAVVENGYRQPYQIEVVPPKYEAFRDSDESLLPVAKSQLGTIPFDKLDLLIVDEIGKTISGSGMDINVIGKWRATGGQKIPDYHRIVALSLTEPSLGNGLGAGLADFTTQRLLNCYDPGVTYVNLLTASEPGNTTWEGPLPLGLANDREAIEVALYSALPGEQPGVCRIRNTAELGEFWISEGLLAEARLKPRLTVLGDPEPLPFDVKGNLF